MVMVLSEFAQGMLAMYAIVAIVFSGLAVRAHVSCGEWNLPRWLVGLMDL
jgi:hypothetical protein